MSGDQIAAALGVTVLCGLLLASFIMFPALTSSAVALIALILGAVCTLRVRLLIRTQHDRSVELAEALNARHIDDEVDGWE